jgi:hypothetical protein
VIGIAAGAGALLALVVVAALYVARRKQAVPSGGASAQPAAAGSSSRPQSVVRGAINPFSRSSKLALGVSSRKGVASPQQQLQQQQDVTVVANPLSETRSGETADSESFTAHRGSADALRLTERGRNARVTAMFDRHSAAPVGVDLGEQQALVQLPGAVGV